MDDFGACQNINLIIMAFLVFEGIDGAGKSTLIQKTKQYLHAEQGLDVVVSREPGGTPLGEAIRPLLLQKGPTAPCPKAELLLYQASRAQHSAQHIEPALKQGKWVISDRFAASSLAFQAGGRGLKEPDIKWLNNFATGGLQPHLYVLLDLPVEQSLERLKNREQNTNMDRFESQKAAFHQRVREHYLSQARAASTRWLVINASKSPQHKLHTLVARLQKMGLLNDQAPARTPTNTRADSMRDV